MTTKQFTAQTESAWGTKIDPISFTYEVELFDSVDEVRSKYTPKELDELILSSANAAQKANARAKATNEALEAKNYKKPDVDSEDEVIKRFVRDLRRVNKNLTEEEARQRAQAMLAAAKS